MGIDHRGGGKFRVVESKRIKVGVVYRVISEEDFEYITCMHAQEKSVAGGKENKGRH